MSELPREANSKEILPVPENKSSTFNCVKSYRFQRILNNPSLAISVVGRTGNFLGGENRRPLCFPEIIRIQVCSEKVDGGGKGFREAGEGLAPSAVESHR